MSSFRELPTGFTEDVFLHRSEFGPRLGFRVSGLGLKDHNAKEDTKSLKSNSRDRDLGYPGFLQSPRVCFFGSKYTNHTYFGP